MEKSTKVKIEWFCFFSAFTIESKLKKKYSITLNKKYNITKYLAYETVQKTTKKVIIRKFRHNGPSTNNKYICEI